jgi:hypothetical protein
MVEPLRHRQTKGAVTDMFYLMPPRHISTLPDSDLSMRSREVRFTPNERTSLADMRWAERHINFRAGEFAIPVTFVHTPDTRLRGKFTSQANPSIVQSRLNYEGRRSAAIASMRSISRLRQLNSGIEIVQALRFVC